VIVVSAVNGVEPMTHRMMDFAKARGLPRLIVINKIDSRDARTGEVLEEIREAFGKTCLPLNLPADSGRRWSTASSAARPPADIASVRRLTRSSTGWSVDEG
jgi:elongation factor G